MPKEPPRFPSPEWFRVQPSNSRWWLTITLYTSWLGFLSMSLGLLAIWLPEPHRGGIPMLVLFAVMFGISFLCGVGAIIIAIFFWHNPRNSDLDLLVRGFVRGAINSDIPPINDFVTPVERQIDTLGRAIGAKTVNWIGGKNLGAQNEQATEQTDISQNPQGKAGQEDGCQN